MVEPSSRSRRAPTDSSGEKPDENILPDGHRQSRQVLVVGDGLVAVVTAGFLAQAGLDPVLAAPANGRAPRTLAVLWRAGLALLERLGLRRPVERAGTPIASLNCPTANRSWTGVGGKRPSLVGIGRQQLHELITQQLRDDIRASQRTVTALDASAAGVRARFDQGIDEQFDAAVTTTRALVPEDESTPAERTVDTWEFEWPAECPVPTDPTEAWAAERAAFTVPLDGTAGVQLVSTTETLPTTAVSADAVGTLFGPLFDGPSPFEALDGTELQYSQKSCAVPRSVHSVPVALVGPETRTSLPGDCLGVTRGIEDAWILADALAYGPTGVDDALATYSRRRRQRERDILAATAEMSTATPGSATLSPMLRRLSASRALAFSHVLDHSLPEEVVSVPECL